MPSPENGHAESNLNNLEALLPPTVELEPHELELGFEVIATLPGEEFGPTVILGLELPTGADALNFRPQDRPDLGFVGGAARAGLALALNLEPTEPRDIDVIRMEPGPQLPEGWEHTRETWIDLAGYMSRRDLTVNEVLLWFEPAPDGGHLWIYATREAVCDTLEGTICPSAFEVNDGRIQSRLAARAIRFAARETHAGNPVTLNLPLVAHNSLQAFDLALQFERATEAGCEREYIALSRPYFDIPEEVNTPREMLAWLPEALKAEKEQDNDDRPIFEFSESVYRNIDPEGFLQILHNVNETNPDDDPFDDDADDARRDLAAKQFRHFNQLSRDPKLSSEDLTG